MHKHSFAHAARPTRARRSRRTNMRRLCRARLPTACRRAYHMPTCRPFTAPIPGPLLLRKMCFQACTSRRPRRQRASTTEPPVSPLFSLDTLFRVGNPPETGCKLATAAAESDARTRSRCASAAARHAAPRFCPSRARQQARPPARRGRALCPAAALTGGRSSRRRRRRSPCRAGSSSGAPPARQSPPQSRAAPPGRGPSTSPPAPAAPAAAARSVASRACTHMLPACSSDTRARLTTEHQSTGVHDACRRQAAAGQARQPDAWARVLNAARCCRQCTGVVLRVSPGRSATWREHSSNNDC